MKRMFIVECVLVTTTLLAASVVVVQSSTSPTTVPTTAMASHTTSAMEQTAFPTTASTPTNASENTTTDHRYDHNGTTEYAGSTTSGQFITDSNTSTGASVDSTATLAKPDDETQQNTNASSLLSSEFELTSTWIIVIAVGGFTVLTAMPLVIIMILIVALGCVCKKYKRLKKRFTLPPLDTAATSNRTTTEKTTTTMNSDVILRNVVIVDGIDTGTNVAYGRTSTISESWDVRKNSMSMQNTTEADRQNYERNSIVMSGDNAAYGRMSTIVEGTTGVNDGFMVTQDDMGDDDGDPDYVINDVYDSIDT